MKSVIEVCALALVLGCAAGAQNPSVPVLRPGVHVEMAAASHAVAVPAADALDARVIAVTANGKLYLGIKSVEIGALKDLSPGPVYVKADARVPYQTILTVLDALRGRPVVLLTAPPLSNPDKGQIIPPYGIDVISGGR